MVNGEGRSEETAARVGLETPTQILSSDFTSTHFPRAIQTALRSVPSLYYPPPRSLRLNGPPRTLPA